MNFSMTQISWVDLVTLIVLLLGIVRGRKSGLSVELLYALQWLLIIVLAGYCYHFVDDVVGPRPIFSRLTCYISAYLLIALVIKLVITFIKRRVGEKLVEGDAFGRMEYYFGMLAGSIRHACILFLVLNLLQAPYIPPEKIAEQAKYQQNNYGDIAFPTLGSLQESVFKKSLTGQVLLAYFTPIMIHPTSADSKPLRDQDSMGSRRERVMDQVLGQR